MSKNDPHILKGKGKHRLSYCYNIPIPANYRNDDYFYLQHYWQYLHRTWCGGNGHCRTGYQFPLMNLVVAFCTLVSAGGSTLASIRLGQKDLKGATEILSHTLMLCITNSVFFGILSFIFLDDILLFFRCQSRHTSIRTQFHAGNLVGNSYYLYNDRIEQCDARYRVSEESNAYIDGDGSCQYHPRSYLYLPLWMGNAGELLRQRLFHSSSAWYGW